MATAKVLAALRERFDVVLIDGDPIITGLAASVIAAHVNGVILTLARGQEQPQAQRAVRVVETLGARLSGAVFNRAPATDFRDVLQPPSQTAASEGRVFPERLNRFGPLVGAVISSISLSREDDLDLIADGITLARSDAAQRAAA